ncbi:hypothetical protein [uncultured Tateyamaria sp.]|uniref:COG4223 family protein n=1 Tax=uncultured Tateyamaria sp. TaxID=455651 RepID=UPI00262CECB3|nr:hypothetical protein [uncultured Tateyamaria sp.]
MAKRKFPEKGPQDDPKAETPDAPEVDTTTSDGADTPHGTEAETDTFDALALTEDARVEVEEVDPETFDEQEQEQESAAPPPPQPEPERRSIVPMIFAGIIAALAGFIAARSDILEPIFPGLASEAGVDPELVEQLNGTVAGLTERLDQSTEQIATLTTQVETLSQANAPTDLGPLEQQLAALSDRIDGLGSQAGTAPVVPSEAINAALSDLRATAAEQQDEIDRLLADARLARENAEASASSTLARAAVNRVLAAVDNGGPFAAALGDLEQAGVTDIPDALRTAAADGVQPLSELQASASDAARDALAAARAAEEGGGLGAFFERQLGTRSILPKEGSDPDAVLSRIEAAAREGRLGDALAEAEALPEAAQAALAPWLEQAQQRHEAVTAANALAQSLSAL